MHDAAEKVRSSMTSAFHEEKVAVEGVADKNQGAFWFHSCREMRCLPRVNAEIRFFLVKNREETRDHFLTVFSTLL